MKRVSSPPASSVALMAASCGLGAAGSDFFFFGGAPGSMLASWVLTLRWPLAAALGMPLAAAAAPASAFPDTQAEDTWQGSSSPDRATGSG
ncbi:MAG: hypothetical protein VB143_08315 [Burkholderia sp.]